MQLPTLPLRGAGRPRYLTVQSQRTHYSSARPRRMIRSTPSTPSIPSWPLSLETLQASDPLCRVSPTLTGLFLVANAEWENAHGFRPQNTLTSRRRALPYSGHPRGHRMSQDTRSFVAAKAPIRLHRAEPSYDRLYPEPAGQQAHDIVAVSEQRCQSCMLSDTAHNSCLSLLESSCSSGTPLFVGHAELEYEYLQSYQSAIVARKKGKVHIRTELLKTASVKRHLCGVHLHQLTPRVPSDSLSQIGPPTTIFQRPI